MGILEFVNNEHAGLIPRATSQIFEYISRESSADINVSLSFLQLYRETIQDLLSPANTAGSSSSNPNSGANTPAAEENLPIREDPIRGFYVEGLQEFTVRSYGEAEALINLGLENRAIAPTLMNATSSRSHIVLTINIEQKLYGDGTTAYSKTLRSKLLMVDLAGSERVRRTISKGTRLSEAKSINTSLSALGNVIVALAENTSHIPYRDSKLTRLLQDSLGGTASTALIATIGPAAVNYGETLSTLLFAQRCMAVKITPIPHEEVDYAEMCAKLQAQVNSMEGIWTEKLVSQQEIYENTIRSLNQQLEDERYRFQQHEYEATHSSNSNNAANEDFNNELYQLLSHLEKFNNEQSEEIEESWLRKPAGWSVKELDSITKEDLPNGQLVTVLAYCFELIKYLSNELQSILEKNVERDKKTKDELEIQFEIESENEKNRSWELSNMHLNDPRTIQAVKEGKPPLPQKIGSHLAPLTKLEALTRVEGQYRSNNLPFSQFDRENILPIPFSSYSSSFVESFYSFDSIQDIAISLINIKSYIAKTISSVNITLERKDSHYKHVKNELTSQLVEKRKREEEVINWSYILKYLLASSSKLRKELNQEKRIQSKIASIQNPANNRNRNGQLLSSLHNKVTETAELDLSMASDIDKMSLNESIIHKLEHTLLNAYKTAPKSTSNSSQSASERSNRNGLPFNIKSGENQFVPFSAPSSSVPNQRNSKNLSGIAVPSAKPLFKQHDDETMSVVSEAPPPPPPLHPSSNDSNLHRPPFPRVNNPPNHNNSEALERVKLRMEMTQNDNRNGSSSQPPHQQAAASRNQEETSGSDRGRKNSVDSVNSHSSMSKLFNPSVTQQDTYQTPTPAFALPPNKFKGGAAVGDPKEDNERLRNPTIGSSVFPIASQSVERDDEYEEEERFSVDGSEYSISSTTRSFRSAATPNSIPLPRYRKSTKQKDQEQDHQFPNNENMLPSRNTQSSSLYQGFTPRNVSSSGVSSREEKGFPPSHNQQSSVAPSFPFKMNLQQPSSDPLAVPSVFAQEIVRNLGVQGPQAISIMSVIDRVKDISPDQLSGLDPETRDQIIQIRQDLGIDSYILSNQQRRATAEMNHIQRTRSSSNPRSAKSGTESAGISSMIPPSVSRSSVGSSGSPNRLRPTSADARRLPGPPSLPGNHNRGNANRRKDFIENSRKLYSNNNRSQVEGDDDEDDTFSQIDLVYK
jgi:hypothetical protein